MKITRKKQCGLVVRTSGAFMETVNDGANSTRKAIRGYGAGNEMVQ